MKLSKIQIARYLAYRKYLESNYSKRAARNPFLLILSTSLIRLAGAIRQVAWIAHRPKPVDILFIMGCHEDAVRMEPIINALNSRDVKTDLEIRKNRIDALKRMSFGFVPLSIPKELVVDYAEAAFYARKYRTKAIVMMENSCLYPSILRILTSAKTVNIAHGVRVDAWEHSYIDFDYYLLFGKSSLSHLRNNKRLFGSTRAVLSGSPFVDAMLARTNLLPERGHIVYFSQYLNPLVIEDILFSNQVFLDFVARNPESEFTVKLHPLEDGTYWKEFEAKFSNMKIAARSSSIDEVLSGACMSIVAWSNCAIESAVANCPVVSIDRTGFANKYLEMSSFFPVVDTVSKLEEATAEIGEHYQDFQQICRNFVNHHLSHIENAREAITGTLLAIYSDDHVELTDVNERYSW